MTRLNAAMRKAVHGFRLVWPPAWLIATLFVPWVLTEWLYLENGYRTGNWEMLQPCLYPRDAFFIFAAAAYGMYRALAFHPVLNEPYYEWLAGTPWTRTKPLPLGPIMLVPHDALFIVLLVAFGLHHPELSVILPTTFLGAYVAASCLPLALTGPTWNVYLLLFGLAGVIRLTIASRPAGLAAMGAVAACSQGAIWLALAQFPWQQRLAAIRTLSPQSSEFPFRRTATARQRSGDLRSSEVLQLWPFRQLHFDMRSPLLKRWDYRLISLLAGSLAYSIHSVFPETQDGQDVVQFLSLAIACAVAGQRVISYCQFHHPPISFLGRIEKRQWFIPGYDVVFIAPLVTLICGIALPCLLLSLGVRQSLAFGITVAATLWTASLMGPDKQRWQLTCPCRIVHWDTDKRGIEAI